MMTIECDLQDLASVKACQTELDVFRGVQKIWDLVETNRGLFGVSMFLLMGREVLFTLSPMVL